MRTSWHYFLSYSCVVDWSLLVLLSCHSLVLITVSTCQNNIESWAGCFERFLPALSHLQLSQESSNMCYPNWSSQQHHEKLSPSSATLSRFRKVPGPGFRSRGFLPVWRFCMQTWCFFLQHGTGARYLLSRTVPNSASLLMPMRCGTLPGSLLQLCWPLRASAEDTAVPAEVLTLTAAEVVGSGALICHLQRSGCILRWGFSDSSTPLLSPRIQLSPWVSAGPSRDWPALPTTTKSWWTRTVSLHLLFL